MIKNRYFTDGNKYFIEKITWERAGTNGIAMNDGRCVSLDGLPGKWFPANMSNPAFSLPDQELVYVETDHVNPETGIVETVQMPVGALDYPVIDCYNLPLLPGLIEISKEEYNQQQGEGD